MPLSRDDASSAQITDSIVTYDADSMASLIKKCYRPKHERDRQARRDEESGRLPEAESERRSTLARLLTGAEW